MTANPTVLDILDPRTDALIRAIIEGFTDVSGKFIAARYPPRDVAPQPPQLDSDDTTPAQALQGHGDAGNGHHGASANGSGGGGNGSKRTARRTKSRTAKRTRNATQKVLDYLEDHPSDTSLSTDTLLLKLAKARIKVGRSSVGKALGIARVNGHETGR